MITSFTLNEVVSKGIQGNIHPSIAVDDTADLNSCRIIDAAIHKGLPDTLLSFIIPEDTNERSGILVNIDTRAWGLTTKSGRLLDVSDHYALVFLNEKDSLRLNSRLNKGEYCILSGTSKPTIHKDNFAKALMTAIGISETPEHKSGVTKTSSKAHKGPCSSQS